MLHWCCYVQQAKVCRNQALYILLDYLDDNSPPRKDEVPRKTSGKEVGNIKRNGFNKWSSTRMFYFSLMIRTVDFSNCSLNCYLKSAVSARYCCAVNVKCMCLVHANFGLQAFVELEPHRRMQKQQDGEVYSTCFQCFSSAETCLFYTAESCTNMIFCSELKQQYWLQH